MTRTCQTGFMAAIHVAVSRWTCRGPWWRGWRRQNGLELHIEGHGYTQTYGTRDLDVARMMVLDYLATVDTPAPHDAEIQWTDSGG